MQPNNNNHNNINILVVPKNNPTKKINSNHKNANNATLNAANHHRSHGSITQACAACKYQRRKCDSGCILAPYFPHDRQRQFLNAHRLFGVSNIVKIVRHLDPPAKDHAMRTIIFQSDARAADPVGGCHRIIRDLEHQISLARAELEVVLHHLALCRAAAAARPPSTDDLAVVDDGNSCWSTCVRYGRNVNNNNDMKAPAESPTSSSFPYQGHNNNIMNSLSMEDCDHEEMRSILDHLSGDDDETRHDIDHQYKFDSNGEILSSNNGISTEERGASKEDDDDDDPFRIFKITMI